MSVAGLCQVCESRNAEHQCPNCGALVCDVHFEDDLGICTTCASARGDRPGDDSGDDIEPGEEYQL